MPRPRPTPLLVALAFAGCGSEPKSPPPPPPPKAAIATPAAGSVHEHKAPHGGTLVELGEEFAHLELLLDQKSGVLTAYVLDGEAENTVRLKQESIEMAIRINASAPRTITLKAVPDSLSGETIGDTSKFSAEIAQLKGLTSFDGVLTHLSVRGTDFRQVGFRFPEGNHAGDSEN